MATKPSYVYDGTAWVPFGSSGSDGANGADAGVITAAPFAWAGTVAVAAGASMRWYVQEASTLLGVQASLRTPSSSGDVIVDVNLNGTTVFVNQANRPTIAAASNYSGYVTSADVTALAAGDFFTVDVDGAGTNAADLLVTIHYSPTGA